MESSIFSRVLQHVERSIHFEQVFCSIVTEMKYMAPFQNQAGLQRVHKENYETSYHRNTAAGNLKRLTAGAGASATQLILMTVECFLEAQEHDQNAEQALGSMTASNPQEQSWLDAAQEWHLKRKEELQIAAQILRESIPADLWNQGAALTE
ncbi:MAG: hypothetical protein JWN30_2337 [Bacilli bacterium]|nr:hypothetical protein [Bacilli bacterium]